MKKSLVFIMVLIFGLGIAGPALAAANPFVDVPANHWAYNAVAKLAQAGIIDGYSDGTFRGDKILTRYELAQVVAKALTKEDKADAEQKALIDKLAVEFAGELNNLGVRVTKLEQNQNPLKFSGEVFIRYTANDYNTNGYGNGSFGQWRLRLNATANIDDQTTATLRFTSQPGKPGANYLGKYNYNTGTFIKFGSSEGLDGNQNSFRFDRVYLTRNIGAVKTTVGAQPLQLDPFNVIVDGSQYSFDGVSLAGKSGAVNLGLVWGRFQTYVDVAALNFTSNIGKLTYGGAYATAKDNSSAGANFFIAKYVTGNLNYQFDKKFSLGGVYVKNQSNDLDNVRVNTITPNGDDKTAWFVKAVYGTQTLKKRGDQNLVGTYYKFGRNSVTRWSSLDVQQPLLAATGGKTSAVDLVNLKGWTATYNYAWSNNLTSFVMYEKIADDDKYTSEGGDRGYKFYRIGLIAKF